MPPSTPTDRDLVLPAHDTWRHAYQPRPGELVHALCWDRLAVVAAVDPARGRALLCVDDPESTGREWEWFSMLRPLRRRERPPNRIEPFVLERCELHAEAWIVSAALRAAYVDWCEANSRQPLSWEGMYFALVLLGPRPRMRWLPVAESMEPFEAWRQGAWLQGPPVRRRLRKYRGWEGIRLR